MTHLHSHTHNCGCRHTKCRSTRQPNSIREAHVPGRLTSIITASSLKPEGLSHTLFTLVRALQTRFFCRTSECAQRGQGVCPGPHSTVHRPSPNDGWEAGPQRPFPRAGERRKLIPGDDACGSQLGPALKATFAGAGGHQPTGRLDLD